MEPKEESKASEMIKVTLIEIMTIKPLLYRLNIPTRSDLQRVDDLIAVCDNVEKTRFSLIESFKNEKGLSNEAEIDEYNIHFKELYNKVAGTSTELQRSAIARFTKNEFEAARQGAGFNYAQVKLLEQYLIMPTTD